MTQEDHFDVASYALGVLDEHDASRFEDHLIECSRCAYELESFVEVADLLADVDANSVIAAEETRRDGFMLQKVIGEVAHERHRANSRRLYSLAAAVVIFAMLSIGAFFVGGQVFGNDSADPSTTNTAQRGNTQLDPLPNTDGGPGIGGPDLTGERYDGSDPRTGVAASVAFEKKAFGTQVSFAISNISGPKECRLVAVHTDGTTEPLMSWTVGENGWGTAKNAEPLLLQAVTATPRDQIAHVQVQEVAANGAGETLVRVP
ncbi:zf-HC2 domain-containing protein [Actinoplanes sp. LDG1-06]|uniref:Zf-HC2 domain-containing protein n=1 Tax=Paractinoplanes ovalisporus TaxID=2810368 RepID=A0ABS2AF41_9ACTN|nr:zf-HC2 domain-containing protein [Actinoplanes ovalisporus]MBM2617856.1 zf-HC2 domain-containing protein [Actinoplanes ovalisporus]